MNSRYPCSHSGLYIRLHTLYRFLHVPLSFISFFVWSFFLSHDVPHSPKTATCFYSPMSVCTRVCSGLDNFHGLALSALFRILLLLPTRHCHHRSPVSHFPTII